MAAQKAEAERFDTPVLVIRQVRKRSLSKLGKGSMPEGYPWMSQPDFSDLGPLERGKRYEAYENRHSAPEVWNSVSQPRPMRRKLVAK